MPIDEIPVTIIPVTLNGQALLWLKDKDGSGPLAYPHHVDEDGHIKPEHVFSESFAHVFSDGTIFRLHSQIGTVTDLQSRTA